MKNNRFRQAFFAFMISKWPKADTIRLVENRLTEQMDERWYRRSNPNVQDLEVWLKKERDGQSWNQIARKHFPERYKPSTKKNWAAISAARRAYARVERFLNPSKAEALKRYVEQEKQKQRIGNLPVAALHHCSPDYFEDHILSRRGTKHSRHRSKSP